MAIIVTLGPGIKAGRHTCPKCQTVFDYFKSDIDPRQEVVGFDDTRWADPIYELHSYVKCPACGFECRVKPNGGAA